MIRVIGYKRVLAVAALAAAFAFIFFYSTYSLAPGMIENQQELGKNNSEITQMTEDMDKLAQGVEEFNKHRDLFDAVNNSGFFDSQDRVETRQRLNGMLKESRLLPSTYSIKQAENEKNELAAAAGYKILNTEIDLNLAALEDTDIYTFLHLLNYGFPGQISITRMEISRVAEVTVPLLQKIGTGGEEPIIKATVQATWRTMVVDPSLEQLVDDAENASDEVSAEEGVN